MSTKHSQQPADVYLNQIECENPNLFGMSSFSSQSLFFFFCFFLGFFEHGNSDTQQIEAEALVVAALVVARSAAALPHSAVVVAVAVAVAVALVVVALAVVHSHRAEHLVVTTMAAAQLSLRRHQATRPAANHQQPHPHPHPHQHHQQQQQYRAQMSASAQATAAASL